MVVVVFFPGEGGGVLDISLGGEAQRGPSYPDPVLNRVSNSSFFVLIRVSIYQFLS